jgi:hypothetical protein
MFGLTRSAMVRRQIRNGIRALSIIEMRHGGSEERFIRLFRLTPASTTRTFFIYGQDHAMWDGDRRGIEAQSL